MRKGGRGWNKDTRRTKIKISKVAFDIVATN